MGRRRRLGTATVEVLNAIADGHRYGFEIMDETGLAGGTVYPALATLERDSLVDSAWEDPEIARAEKRPPRRYYALTRKGRARLDHELARLRRLGAASAPDTAGEGPATESPSRISAPDLGEA